VIVSNGLSSLSGTMVIYYDVIEGV